MITTLLTLKNKYMNNKYTLYGIIAIALSLVAVSFWYNSPSKVSERNRNELQSQISALLKSNEQLNASIKEKMDLINTLSGQIIESKDKVLSNSGSIEKLNACIKANSFPCSTADSSALSYLVSSASAAQAIPEPSIGVPQHKEGEIQIQLEDNSNHQVIRMMDKFGLNGCRFTNSQHFLPRLDFSWYGYDYACDVGQPFNVSAPAPVIIEKISYDKNLGNYIILKHQKDPNIRFVLGHIKTTLKVGDKLQVNDIIGQTVKGKNGSSSGTHIHVEVWYKNLNVSYEFTLGLPYQSIDGATLLKDRGHSFSNYNLDTSFLQSMECPNGFILISKWDHQQHSSGCGTYSPYEGEKITVQEAERRLREEYKKSFDFVYKDFPDYPLNKLQALASLHYNIPAGYVAVRSDIKNNKDPSTTWKKFIYASKVIQGGLVKRRTAELNHYLK